MQLEPQLLHLPAATATLPQRAAEHPLFAWNFFETTVKATEDVRIRGNVAQGGELQSKSLYEELNTRCHVLHDLCFADISVAILWMPSSLTRPYAWSLMLEPGSITFTNTLVTLPAS